MTSVLHGPKQVPLRQGQVPQDSRDNPEFTEPGHRNGRCRGGGGIKEESIAGSVGKRPDDQSLNLNPTAQHGDSDL